jgi:hypothetical protein
MTRTISRRQLVGGAAAGFAGGLLAAPAVVAQTAPTRLTFAFAPDESGAIQNLSTASTRPNDAPASRSPGPGAEESDDFFRLMVSEFEAGSTTSTSSART